MTRCQLALLLTVTYGILVHSRDQQGSSAFQHFTCPRECECTSVGPLSRARQQTLQQDTTVVCTAHRALPTNGGTEADVPLFPKGSLQLDHLELRGYTLHNLSTVAQRILTPAVKSVKRLVLSGLSLAVIHSDELRKWAPTLERLDLARNRLTSLTFLSSLDLSALESLDLRGNSLRQIRGWWFSRLKSLKDLSIDENPMTGHGQLEFIRAAGEALQGLQSLQANDIGLKTVTAQDFKFIRSLTVLGLSDNRLKSLSFLSEEVTVPEHRVRRVREKYIDKNTTGHSIRHFGGKSARASSTNAQPSLAYKLKRQSSLGSGEHAQVYLYSPFRNLRSLSVSNNRLGSGPGVGVHASWFTATLHLRHLYLDRNQIEDSEFLSALTLPDLETLDVSQNQITGPISETSFRYICDLYEIYLHDNYITSLDECSISRLPRLRELTVRENPVACGCLSVWFRSHALTREEAGVDPIDCPGTLSDYEITNFPLPAPGECGNRPGSCPRNTTCGSLPVTQRLNLKTITDKARPTTSPNTPKIDSPQKSRPALHSAGSTGGGSRTYSVDFAILLSIPIATLIAMSTLLL